jgi:hypothetical protein
MASSSNTSDPSLGSAPPSSLLTASIDASLERIETLIRRETESWNRMRNEFFASQKTIDCSQSSVNDAQNESPQHFTSTEFKKLLQLAIQEQFDATWWIRLIEFILIGFATGAGLAWTLYLILT